MPSEEVYFVRENTMKIEVLIVNGVTKEQLELNDHPDRYDLGHRNIERTDSYIQKYKQKNGRFCYFFSDIKSANRYVKAQTYKNIRQLVDNAKNSLKIVNDFRIQYYDILKNSKIDDEINILENLIKEN